MFAMINPKMFWRILAAAAFTACLVSGLHAEPAATGDRKVGDVVDGATVTRDGRLVHAAGDVLTTHHDPVDVIATPDGSLLLVKSGHGLTIIDAKTFAVVQTLTYKEVGGSMHGLAVVPAESGDGWTVYFTSSAKAMLEAHVSRDGKAEWGRKIALGGAHNWGIAISPNGKFAYVCMSVKNTLGVVDLAKGDVLAEIPVGVSPYDVVLSPDGETAFVTNFGGSHPTHGESTEKSVGTDVSVDNRSIPNSGTVSRVDLQTGKAMGQIKTGLHPTQIVRDAKGTRYYVANANSDTVSVIDPTKNSVTETIEVRPDPSLPYGSVPNGLALSPDDKTLYVVNGGNDAVAVIGVGHAGKSVLQGFIPAGWFPGGVTCFGSNVYIVNTLGGDLNRVPAPGLEQLKTYTRQVMKDEQVPRMLRELARSKSTVAPVPVPAHVGEPSVFKHVVYILKENKTYDQVLGDIGKGNSDPKLCVYGQSITPNQHAMANQFVLLDNYYCNGVNSSEGHQWATQGIIGEYFEKGSRTYDFGTDALCYAGCDFIWDSCLMHGLTIRNYGEFDFPTVTSKPKTWFDVYQGWDKGTVTFKQSVELETLMRYTCHEYPGWNLAIPDVCRTKVFMKEFAQFEKSGNLPDFLLVYLPQDHTSGRGQTVPTPRSMVADNDLSTGQVVEAISRSRFWKDTCIFCNEDDPQSGYDHVDGHRSICMIVSPYTKRNAIVSTFYNQTSVLHTMTQMLGLPPMNQTCAAASTMEDCFDKTPDLRPFQCATNMIALDEHNPKKEAMAKPERDLADAVDKMDFSRPDLADENKLNRLIWIASGRTEPYPAEFTGAHGKGLAALHLKLDHDADGDDDGD
jgi:YVTN family beta-propeller protein